MCSGVRRLWVDDGEGWSKFTAEEHLKQSGFIHIVHAMHMATKCDLHDLKKYFKKYSVFKDNNRK